MTKTKLMLKLKDKFGGTYTKENGRWFWSKGKERHLVTTNWLLSELEKPMSKTKSEPKKEKVVLAEPKVSSLRKNIFQPPVEEVPPPVVEEVPPPVVEEVPPVVTEEVVNETPITE